MTTTTHRAAVVRNPGGPEAIEIIDAPVTDPGPGQVRVNIAAASVNPVDLVVAGGRLHSLGLIDQPEHTGLGWDFAGVIEHAGPDVDPSYSVGTRVAGIVPGFDRDFGTYAESVVVPVSDIAVVPDGLDLVDAATVPLNGLTAAQLVDLLGEGDGRDLLVTGAAGAVGAYAVTFATDHGWRVTGYARPQDEDFVRGLGADFTTEPTGRWDAVADGAVLQERGVALVRDGGLFVGVQPSAPPVPERGVTVRAVSVTPDADRLADLMERTVSGELPPRVHAEVPLADVAKVHEAVAQGGVRGRYVLRP